MAEPQDGSRRGPCSPAATAGRIVRTSDRGGRRQRFETSLTTRRKFRRSLRWNRHLTSATSLKPMQSGLRSRWKSSMESLIASRPRTRCSTWLSCRSFCARFPISGRLSDRSTESSDPGGACISTSTCVRRRLLSGGYSVWWTQPSGRCWPGAVTPGATR